MLRTAHAGSQELSAQCYHMGELKWAMVETLTPWKWENTSNQGFFFFFVLPSQRAGCWMLKSTLLNEAFDILGTHSIITINPSLMSCHLLSLLVSPSSLHQTHQVLP